MQNTKSFLIDDIILHKTFLVHICTEIDRLCIT